MSGLPQTGGAASYRTRADASQMVGASVAPSLPDKQAHQVILCFVIVGFYFVSLELHSHTHTSGWAQAFCFNCFEAFSSFTCFGFSLSSAAKVNMMVNFFL